MQARSFGQEGQLRFMFDGALTRVQFRPADLGEGPCCTVPSLRRAQGSQRDEGHMQAYDACLMVFAEYVFSRVCVCVCLLDIHGMCRLRGLCMVELSTLCVRVKVLSSFAASKQCRLCLDGRHLVRHSLYADDLTPSWQCPVAAPACSCPRRVHAGSHLYVFWLAQRAKPNQCMAGGDGCLAFVYACVLLLHQAGVVVANNCAYIYVGTSSCIHRTPSCPSMSPRNGLFASSCLCCAFSYPTRK